MPPITKYQLANGPTQDGSDQLVQRSSSIN